MICLSVLDMPPLPVRIMGIAEALEDRITLTTRSSNRNPTRWKVVLRITSVTYSTR